MRQEEIIDGIFCTSTEGKFIRLWSLTLDICVETGIDFNSSYHWQITGCHTNNCMWKAYKNNSAALNDLCYPYVACRVKSGDMLTYRLDKS